MCASVITYLFPFPDLQLYIFPFLVLYLAFLSSFFINWLFVLQAIASPSHRRDLLQELFADVALEVDNRAKGKLKGILSENLTDKFIDAAAYPC